MTEHREVDIDLLADYIGGALDGPAEAEVARLIADDARWRETYDLLVPGMVEVGAGLQALGAGPEPMPADVAARLEAALTSEPAYEDRAQPRPAPVRDDRHLHVVPGAGADRTARRRRRMRWAAPIAAAAGVIAFAGIGIDRLVDTSAADDVTSAAGGAADQAAPMMESSGLVSVPPDDRIVTTGTDYSRTGLAQEPPVAVREAPEDTNRTKASPRAPAVSQLDADPLRRLQARDALLACLEAIARQRGGAPIAVQAVDYARFEGDPALIVRFVADGATWAWAVGPECGTLAIGANALGTLQVG